MTERIHRASLLLFLLAACGGSSDGSAGPSVTTLDPGQAATVVAGGSVQLQGSAATSEYLAVVVNTNTTAGQSESYTLRGDGIVPASSLVPADAPVAARVASGTGVSPERDGAFESRLRDRERAVLTPKMSAARAWFAARSVPSMEGRSMTRVLAPGARSDGAIPGTATVGQLFQVNVNGVDACTNPVIHTVRVVAITTHAIVVADTLNPLPTFTTADYQRFATRFDTLVYPLDVGAFGAPTDIDGNGRIVLLFTRAVNELTPANSGSYVGGFQFSRDLFPVTTQPRPGAASLTGCAASNVAEMFYLLAPDPLGTVNGNRRSTGFVDSNTTAVIAHEFEHTINASRRLYVNNADVLEVKWLDEGLAHIAEELLFYRESQLSPRQNIGIADLPSGTQKRSAFNFDMIGNAGRYRTFLLAPAKNSPYAADDSLPTRGAAWSLLRYAADRLGSTDSDLFFRLVNSKATGVANFEATLGVSMKTYVRDWSTSNAADDVAATAAEYQQKSWNWHSIFPPLYGSYPLNIPSLPNSTNASGTIVSGGSSYYKLAVPASGSGTVALSGASPSNLQLVIVRTK